MGIRSALTNAAPAVRRYLFGVCGDWDRAEDLAQEALLKAWQAREHFDGRSDITTWLFTIARNHWLDSLRSERRRPREGTMRVEPAQDAPWFSPPARAAWAEMAEAIDDALDELPPEQREALALRESEGLTFAEIAVTLNVPVATVKSRVRYALLKMAASLRPFREAPQ